MKGTFLASIALALICPTLAHAQAQGTMDAAKARGTLPGAVNIDSDLYFELGSAVLLDKASLQTEADAAHAAPGQEVVTFCNAGHWSATDWFVRSEILGEKNVKLYPGSVIDWSQAPEPLPMVNEPTRAAKLRQSSAVPRSARPSCTVV